MGNVIYIIAAAIFLAGVLFSLLFPAFWAVLIAIGALFAAVMLYNKNRGCRR